MGHVVMAVRVGSVGCVSGGFDVHGGAIEVGDVSWVRTVPAPPRWVLRKLSVGAPRGHGLYAREAAAAVPAREGSRESR